VSIAVEYGSGAHEMMSEEGAQNAVENYFREHGSPIEYVRFNGDGSIELKMHTGFKVVINNLDRARVHHVKLC